MVREHFIKMNKMRPESIQASKTLDTAIAELKNISGAGIRKIASSKNMHGNPDAVIEIKLRKIHQEFLVEIKNEIREHMIERLIENIGTEKNKWLIVAKYIPGPIKDFLKKQGYNYLEMTGNCFISTDHLFISVNDKGVKNVLKTAEGKLWKATGLKFLFVILEDPNMLTYTQRDIASAAGIALGNISNLLEELRDGGYIINEEGEEKLQQREKLIDRWVEAFHVTLRPKLQKGIFRFARPDQQKTWREQRVKDIYWTGEPGADLYTDFLNPENFQLYSSRTIADLMVNMKMIVDKNGNILVLDKFWNDWKAKNDILGAAPLLLVYADLKNSLDSRNWEAAEKIKKLLLNAN